MQGLHNRNCATSSSAHVLYSSNFNKHSVPGVAVDWAQESADQADKLLFQSMLVSRQRAVSSHQQCKVRRPNGVARTPCALHCASATLCLSYFNLRDFFPYIATSFFVRAASANFAGCRCSDLNTPLSRNLSHRATVHDVTAIIHSATMQMGLCAYPTPRSTT